MTKIMKTMAKFILLFFIAIYVTLYGSIKYVLTGKSIVGRIAIIGIYAGYVSSCFVNRGIFVIISSILLIGELIFAFFMAKEDSNPKRKEKTVKSLNSLFGGMTLEEAKREYRRLMKLYHPDNGGDLEMAQQISREYSKYQKLYERQEA